MKPDRLLLLLFAHALVIGQSAAVKPPQPTGPAQVGSLPGDSPFRVEVKKFLTIYRFAENARKSFLERADAKPGAESRRKYIDCVASKFTNENLEPYVTPVMSRYLTFQQLAEMNEFLVSPLGQKMLSAAFAQAEGHPQDLRLTSEEQRDMQKLSATAAFRAYAKFNQEGWKTINGSAMKEWKAKYFQECREQAGE